MIFSKYFMLAGAAALLTACSSEEPIAGPGADQPDLSDVETYAQFTIAMVGDNGTRAADDPTFVDGTTAESEIKSGRILVFGVPNNGSIADINGRIKAEFVVAADLTDLTDKTNVQAKFVKGTFSKDAYQAYYGVCLLNAPASWVPQNGTTFEDWAKSTPAELTNTDGSYIMTNAPLYKNGKLNLLTKIDTEQLTDTPEQLADKASAADFKVQRVAAKVELTATKNTNWNFTVTEDDNEIGSATINGWDMDLTTLNSYPVQNVWEAGKVLELFKPDGNNSTAPKYAWFTSTQTSGDIRCHWAYSPAYESTDIKNFARTTAAGFGKALAEPKYIHENTMAPAYMTKGNVTRMVIKATYVPEWGTGVVTDAKGSFFNVKTYGVLTPAQMKDIAVEACSENNVTMSADDITIISSAKGSKTLSEVVKFPDVNDDKVYAAVYGSIANKLRIYSVNDKAVDVYTNGECYYTVYIRHFRDAQEASDIADAKVPAEGIALPSLYKDETVGRYGILRNNWYVVNVEKITGLGLPDVPAVDPEKPVDDQEKEEYRNMKVSITTMPWAKRTQNETL